MKQIILLSVLLLTACATPKMGMVIPQEDGSYTTNAFGASEKQSQEVALYTASKTCENRQMRHAVVSMETAYKGEIDEKVNKTVGTVASLLNSRLTTASEEDYKTVMQFKCLP